MRSRSRLVIALALLTLPLMTACDDDDAADTGPTPEPRDGGSDALLDGSSQPDALLDGGRDAMVDATADMTADATADATVDATVDMMPDATADATPADQGTNPDQGTDCVPAGGSIPVIPGAPVCCAGLQNIGCDRPDPAGVCPGGCEGASICADCGDGACGPGENHCNCPADCMAPGRCDDGSLPVCQIEPPICQPHEERAVIAGCWLCVNPATCRPWGQPGCAADADCAPGERCDDCASSSCPECDDCIAACVPEPGCPGPNPAGCMSTGCPDGQRCEVGNSCNPSNCLCDNGNWLCTDDCGGGECVPPDGALRWFETCGDPVCRGHQPDPAIPPCAAGTRPGAACAERDRGCDPIDACNVRLICTDSDPRMGGPCPISRADHKREIHYLAPEERRRYANTLLATRLATWRYAITPAARPSLGFIIDDGIAPEAITADGTRVDLYGYTSLAVAAVQEQSEEIARLRAELMALRARLDETESQCR